MRQITGEQVLMRIHLSENDKAHGDLAYRAIVQLLRERGLAGCTVMRGAMSFGANAKIHSDRIELLSLDMPIVIECVDTEENIRGILPEIDRMVGGGLITLERADVIFYRPDETVTERE